MNFLVMVLAFELLFADFSAAQNLGEAAPFAVLGASAVTNTGHTTLDGDVRYSPATARSGFPRGVVVPPGTTHIAQVAQNAQAAALNTFNVAAGLPANSV